MLKIKDVLSLDDHNYNENEYSAIYYMNLKEKMINCDYSVAFETYIIDLEIGKDILFSNLHPSYKRDYNQIMDKSRVKFEDNPKKEEILIYIKKYNEFAKFKKLPTISWGVLENMLQKNNLYISYGFIFNNELSINLYYLDRINNEARLLHTISVYNENINISDAAKLKKYHIFNDWIALKNHKIKTLDLGGAGNIGDESTKMNGIRLFKRRFGGKKIIKFKGLLINKNSDKVKAQFNDFIEISKKQKILNY